MAKKKDSAPSSNADQSALLAQAVQALQTNVPMMAQPATMAGLVNHPTLGQLVEYTEAVKDGAGNIAFRATPNGVTVHNSGQLNGASASTGAPPQQAWGSTPQPAFSAPAPGAVVGGPSSGPRYAIKKGIPIPEARFGRGPAAEPLGLENMDVGDCLEIPSTPDNPNPAKRIASTVSGATKKFAPKRFTVRSVDENGGKLARIWRVA